MICKRLINGMWTCWLGKLCVEDVIMDYIWEEYKKDERILLTTKQIVDTITQDYTQFTRVDVVQGLIQLCWEGRINEVYPQEYSINESWE